jgi:ribosomal protein S6--L-glutamate ligase
MLSSNNLMDFSSFINEAKSNAVQVIMLIGGGTNEFSRSFESECKKKKIKVNVFDVDLAEVQRNKSGNGHTITEGKRTVNIDPSDTVVIARSGCLKSTHNKELLMELENSKYYVVNRLRPMEICENKYITSEFLEKLDLPVPRYALIASEDHIDDAVKKIGGKFPVVMKLLTGSQGIGVSIIDSPNSLKSVYQTIKKLDEKSEVLIQEKIESKYDLRIHVVIRDTGIKNLNNTDNFKIIGAMRRNAVGKDFRTNYSLGGTVSNVKLSKEVIETAIKAASAVGCNWCGVDIMIDEKTKKPYILEVNSSPGTEGISKALGKPIVDDVIDFVINRENWVLPSSEVGYLEVMEIEGLGKVIAKFDTGNGTLCCCLHGDKVEAKGRTLHYEIGHKKFSKKITGYTEVSGGMNTKGTKKHPTIKLDLKFNGVVFPDIDVAIIDRTDKSTPFLVNRKTMRLMNVLVNPNTKFIVTENFDDRYSQYTAKGKPHTGIEFEK